MFYDINTQQSKKMVRNLIDNSGSDKISSEMVRKNYGHLKCQ